MSGLMIVFAAVIVSWTVLGELAHRMPMRHRDRGFARGLLAWRREVTSGR